MTACGRGLIDVYDVALPDGGMPDGRLRMRFAAGRTRGKERGCGAGNQVCRIRQQLGEQMEGTIASVEKTPFGGPAEVSVGRPYVSGLRMLCRRATLTDPHREMTVAVCRRPSEEWTLVEPIFEPLPR